MCSIFFEALITVRGIVLALSPYATGIFTLHRVLRARAKPRQAFFVFHFCLIPLVSEGIIGPFIIEGVRWMLPAEAAAKTASGSAEHGGSRVGRNGVWFVCFCFSYSKSAGRGSWVVFLHERAGMHAAITGTFWT